jgi:hypothetical protein
MHIPRSLNSKTNGKVDSPRLASGQLKCMHVAFEFDVHVHIHKHVYTSCMDGRVCMFFKLYMCYDAAVCRIRSKATEPES